MCGAHRVLFTRHFAFRPKSAGVSLVGSAGRLSGASAQRRRCEERGSIGAPLLVSLTGDGLSAFTPSHHQGGATADDDHGRDDGDDDDERGVGSAIVVST